MARIIVVNENDEEIGVKDIATVTVDEIYRVSALWITSSQGDVLLAQRAFEKRKDPGKWGPAVAGTVDEGEDYDINIVKETQEELGLSVAISDLKRGPKVRVSTSESNYFCQWYVYTTDVLPQDLSIRREEVVQVAWFSPEQIKKEFAEEPEKFIRSMQKCKELFLS